MDTWKGQLTYDPTIPLSQTDDIAIRYAYETDIVGHCDILLSDIWSSPAATKIMHRQSKNGSWPYAGKRSWSWPMMDYNQYETTKQIAVLVEKYRLTKDHPALLRAADYFFTHQTDEGDIRGIYGAQYTPNYTALILELLIHAKFESDPRVIKSLDWLLATQQDDGGWALPFRTRGFDLDSLNMPETITRDSSKPSSHMVTGVVLRALAAHPQYRTNPSVKQATRLLTESLLEKDAYADRGDADYWLRFAFPFQYTDLASALDTLSLLGTSVHHPKIQQSLKLLQSRQTPAGLFNLHTVRGNHKEQGYWMSLAICKIYKRLWP